MIALIGLSDIFLALAHIFKIPTWAHLVIITWPSLVSNINLLPGFVGSLSEIWSHARAVHNVLGSLQLQRLDGAIWSDLDEGSFIEQDKIYVNSRGEYFYVCLETHAHKWRQKTSKICPMCLKTGYLSSFNRQDFPVLSSKEENQILRAIKTKWGD